MPMLVKFYQSHPENPENPENPDSDIFTFCHANVGEICLNKDFSDIFTFCHANVGEICLNQDFQDFQDSQDFHILPCQCW